MPINTQHPTLLHLIATGFVHFPTETARCKREGWGGAGPEGTKSPVKLAFGSGLLGILPSKGSLHLEELRRGRRILILIPPPPLPAEHTGAVQSTFKEKKK